MSIVCDEHNNIHHALRLLHICFTKKSKKQNEEETLWSICKSTNEKKKIMEIISIFQLLSRMRTRMYKTFTFFVVISLIW